MKNAFLPYEEDFECWKESNYPNVKQETREFIINVLAPGKKFKMWKHQIDGLLRTIYSYEVLKIRQICIMRYHVLYDIQPLRKSWCIWKNQTK